MSMGTHLATESIEPQRVALRFLDGLEGEDQNVRLKGFEVLDFPLGVRRFSDDSELRLQQSRDLRRVVLVV